MLSRHRDALKELGYEVHGDQVVTHLGEVVAMIDPYGDLSTREEAILDIFATIPAATILPVKKKRKKID